MIRMTISSLIALAVLSGCTVKEFGDGVSSGVNDVKRVIRGNNN